MSQQRFNKKAGDFPRFAAMSINSAALTTLNATGETVYYCGQVELEDPAGGSKTLSAAGGGSIVFLLGATTFANAGSTFEVGLQDVSTASTPMQGDGTFDVKASFTGGGGGISASTYNTAAMTAGTKTLAHGDLVAITFALTARAGADSVVISQVDQDVVSSLPACTTNISGSITRIANGLACAYIVFDDGSIGNIYGGYVHNATTTVTYNLDTATADEYGNLIILPGTFDVEGIKLVIAAAASSDHEIILYSDPLGTPVAERTVTIDATQLAITSGAVMDVLFTSKYRLKPNTAYGIAVRPTTANNVSLYHIDNNTVAGGGKVSVPNNSAYAIRRIGNSGAFSDYNGGTAKTRLFKMSVIGSYMEQGNNHSFNQLGI